MKHLFLFIFLCTLVACGDIRDETLPKKDDTRAQQKEFRDRVNAELTNEEYSLLSAYMRREKDYVVGTTVIQAIELQREYLAEQKRLKEETHQKALAIFREKSQPVIAQLEQYKAEFSDINSEQALAKYWKDNIDISHQFVRNEDKGNGQFQQFYKVTIVNKTIFNTINGYFELKRKDSSSSHMEHAFSMANMKRVSEHTFEDVRSMVNIYMRSSKKIEPPKPSEIVLNRITIQPVFTGVFVSYDELVRFKKRIQSRIEALNKAESEFIAHKIDANRLEYKFAQYGVTTWYGGTKKAQRDWEVKRYMEKGRKKKKTRPEVLPDYPL